MMKSLIIRVLLSAFALSTLFFCTYTFAEDSKEDSVKEPTVALECGTIKSGVGYVAIQIGDSVYLIKINCDTKI